MIRRLRIKFIGFTMVLICSMLLIIFSLIYRFTERSLEQESIQMMQVIAMTPEQILLPEDAPRQMLLPFFTLRKEGTTYIAEGGGFYDLSDQLLLEKLYTTAFSEETPYGTLPSYHLRFLVVHAPGIDYLVFADMTAENTVLRHLTRDSIIVGLLAVIGFFLISLFLSGRAVRPVEHAWESQKQFVADASHELKTPLSVILSNSEMLSDEKLSSAQKERLLTGIHTVSVQMRELVENMLELARTEYFHSAKLQENVNLSELLTESILLFEPLFFEKKRVLNSSIPENLFVRGNKDQLQRLCTILLDNAEKYSDEGSETDLRLTAEKGKLILTCSNPCKEAAPEDAASLFKRFYRSDQARNARQSFGLGLSIAKAIVENHRGRIRCDITDHQVTFIVSFHESPVS